MQKDKKYSLTRFPASIIKEAYTLYLSMVPLVEKAKMSTTKGNETWYLHTIEEFLSEYNNCDSAELLVEAPHTLFNVATALHIIVFEDSTIVSIFAKDRKTIEAIFFIFENNIDKSRIIKPPVPIKVDPVKVFVGHGNDPQWRLLKDHLHDIHHIEVISYEIAPRAGLTVKKVLEEMLNNSSIAFLVLTGEDIKNYGEIHARQNVVHELGLFQGRLGFERGIALLEEGVKEFSNICGINQIRFSKGNIRETFGDVVATINREFGEKKYSK